MVEYNNQYVTNEDRREFLKAVGATGAIAAGGIGFSEVRDQVGSTAEPAGEMATIGASLRSSLAGELDAGTLAEGQESVATAASALTGMIEQGLPEAEPRTEFAELYSAGLPIYEHLSEGAFFERTTELLPALEPETLKQTTAAFVGSETLSTILSDMHVGEVEATDLVAGVVANAGEISEYHWLATDEIAREQLEVGEFIPPMTKAATGGVVLWLEDLDHELWQKQVILTDTIHENAVWHSRSMAAGLSLVAEGAREITGESHLSDAELTAALTTGFAVQVLAQNQLMQDVHWVTEEMRAPHTGALTQTTEPITR